MEISTLQIIAIFIFSCIAGMGSVLDEFQTHRPLIACTVIGLITGDLKTGVMLGGTLELIALGWMNVGAAQSPDSALASIISAILVIVGHQSIATGIAIALPVAAAGQVLTVFARTITVVFQHAADKAAEEARFRTIDLLHVSALGCRHCAWQSRRWWSRCSLARIWSAVCSARSRNSSPAACRLPVVSLSSWATRWCCE